MASRDPGPELKRAQMPQDRKQVQPSGDDGGVLRILHEMFMGAGADDQTAAQLVDEFVNQLLESVMGGAQQDRTRVAQGKPFNFNETMQGSRQDMAQIDSVVANPPDSSAFGIIATHAAAAMAKIAARSRMEQATEQQGNIDSILQQLGLMPGGGGVQ